MWFFIFILIWWLFCAVSTYCKVQKCKLTTLVKENLQILFRAIVPVSESEHMMTPIPNRPSCSKVFQMTKQVIAQEISWHYFQCPRQCLTTQLFETPITKHHKYISRIMSEFCSDMEIRQASYLYIAPHSQIEAVTCVWDCYEINIIANTDRLGTENMYMKREKRNYSNLTDEPIVIVRVCFETSTVLCDAKPFTSIVNQVKQWLTDV